MAQVKRGRAAPVYSFGLSIDLVYNTHAHYLFSFMYQFNDIDRESTSGGLMKTVILATALAMIGFNAAADGTISKRTVKIPVDISTAKVVKTNAGYGKIFLVKILVPGLAEPTLMNHRNEGESAPCLATYETDNIDDVVQGKPETVVADMDIELTKSSYVEPTDNLCHVQLTETITTKIRGFDFIHERISDLPTRDPGDCR